MRGQRPTGVRESVPRRWLALVPGIAAVAAACGSGFTVPGLAGIVPRCEDVAPIQAPPELYREAPIYVANEMPIDEVRAWAVMKPGFEEIWIDRERLGWVTVAFSEAADARQAELAQQFPGAGVAVVAVDWTRAELEALRDEVIARGRPTITSVGIRGNHGVVTINVGVLEPARVAEIEREFGGRRVCIEGVEPADAPVQGPQLHEGAGWRLVADHDELGMSYRTGIAADAAGFAALWAEIGLPGEVPVVDFEREVAIWFGAVHGSSCPRLRLDDVVVDNARAILHPVITYLDTGACTADAIPHAYVVAVDRAILPVGTFSIQLQADDPPPGAVDQITIVDADLSVPGSMVTPDQLHTAPPPDFTPRVESGGFLEPGYGRMYLYDTRCGIEWLGEFNKLWWRTDVPAGIDTFVPPEWRALLDGDGSIDVSVTLKVDADPVIEAVASGHAVSYSPATEARPACN